MPAIEHLRKWGPRIFILGVGILLPGCKPESVPENSVTKVHNLKYVDCNKHLPNYLGQTEIVVNSASGITPEDEIIFVCTAEKVFWSAGNGVQKFAISFKNNEWPFAEPFQPTLSGDPQNPTPKLDVAALPANYRAKAYKYQIHVVTGSGAIDLDPHIIPMGN